MSYHFINDRAGNALHEPVYLNQFEVTMIPPPAIANQWGSITMDGVKSVSGLDIDKVPEPVEQIYKGAKRSYAGALAENPLDIAITFEVNLNEDNQMYRYNALRAWTDLIWNPLTGETGLKIDYAGGPMIIEVFNKAKELFRKIEFPIIFPMSPLPAMELNYEDGSAIYEIELTFRADYFKETRLQ